MTFSVVIPAYHASETLVRAVDSVLAQTRPASEILIVADDQTDYSRIVRHPTIRFLSTGKTGSGGGNARNIGIDVAANAYIALLDADDEFMPQRLEMLAPLIDRYGAAFTALTMKDHVTGALLPNMNRVFEEEALTPSMLSVAGLHSHGHMAFDKNRCPARFDIMYNIDDVVFALSLYNHVESVGYSSTPLCTYYRRPGSVCNSEGSVAAFLGMLEKALDPQSAEHHVISRYKAWPALRAHLETMREAETRCLAPGNQESFQHYFSALARERLFS